MGACRTSMCRATAKAPRTSLSIAICSATSNHTRIVRLTTAKRGRGSPPAPTVCLTTRRPAYCVKIPIDRACSISERNSASTSAATTARRGCRCSSTCRSFPLPTSSCSVAILCCQRWDADSGFSMTSHHWCNTPMRAPQKRLSCTRRAARCVGVIRLHRHHPAIPNIRAQAQHSTTGSVQSRLLHRCSKSDRQPARSCAHSPPPVRPHARPAIRQCVRRVAVL